MGSKGEVLLFVEESGALKVLQHYNPRDLLARLRPEGLSHHLVAEPRKCSAPEPPRVPDDDFTASLKILFVLVLVVCAVLNITAMFLVDRRLYWISTEEVALLTICAVFILVPILWKFAMKTREKKNTLRENSVKTVSIRVQHV